MSVVEMSVHRGLAELKLYENKINSSMQSTFVVANKKSNKNIGGRTVAEVRDLIKGNFDSITSLIENRKRVKAEIVKSNSKTMVVVGGKEMSVAEAIERKNSVVFEQNFLGTLRNQFNLQNNVVDSKNNELSQKLEGYLQATLGENREAEQVKQLTKTFNDNNEYELVDPAKIQDKIDSLQTQIQEFQSQVDYILSESNAKTFISVELVD